MTLTAILKSSGTDKEHRPIITQCCVCRQYETVDGEFIEPSEAMKLMYSNPLYYSISHTYYPKDAEIEISKMRVRRQH